MLKHRTEHRILAYVAICIIPILATMCGTGAKQVATDTGEVCVAPSFQGGDISKFLDWVYKNIEYPVQARIAEREGTVCVQFVISSTGEVRDVTVVQRAYPTLDAEAVRVISSSPDWTPAQLNGENVSAQYTVPIIFKLRSSQPKQINR